MAFFLAGQWLFRERTHDRALRLKGLRVECDKRASRRKSRPPIPWGALPLEVNDTRLDAERFEVGYPLIRHGST
ncbi:hypothetical protein HNP84_002303 [Thermocatellispora tengchongensis]|uniref:Uncharacterized protein n=1 Tax=Thermocatellispora tengchongensis TaxID=1073253 RepID=A0A840P5T8_9ACTN|nr:hypothetical protein [Thermocatellispora tengchongensis]